MFKTCRICFETKSLLDYYKGRGQQGVRNECKVCYKLRIKVYAAKLTSRLKRSVRDKKYRQKPEVVLYQKAYHAARKLKESV